MICYLENIYIRWHLKIGVILIWSILHKNKWNVVSFIATPVNRNYVCLFLLDVLSTEAAALYSVMQVLCMNESSNFTISQPYRIAVYSHYKSALLVFWSYLRCLWFVQPFFICLWLTMHVFGCLCMKLWQNLVFSPSLHCILK